MGEPVNPYLQCPHCPTGRPVDMAKHIDLSKPAWRRFDCGYYIDDRAALHRLRVASAVPEKELS